MSQPEAEAWYLEPLREVAEELNQRPGLGGLHISPDGSIGFHANVEYAQLIANPDDLYSASSSHFDMFREVRQRLGLAFDEESVSKTDLGSFYHRSRYDFQIDFGKKRLSDAEAMFLLAFPLATPENPVEKVIEGIRAAALFSLAQTTEVKAPEQEPQKTFRSVRIPHDVLPNLVKRLEEVPEVSDIAVTFKRYKELMDTIRGAANKRELIAELTSTEKLLIEQQQAVNPALMARKKLAPYRLHLAQQIDDTQHQDYVRGFSYIVRRDILRLTLPERGRLQLLIMPADYEYERTRAQDGRRKA